MWTDRQQLFKSLAVKSAGTSWPSAAAVILISAALSGCGGSGGGDGTDASPSVPSGSSSTATTEAAAAQGAVNPPSDGTGAGVVALPTRVPANTPIPTTTADAVRLADQATFGPTESLVAEIKGLGASAWLIQQMTLPTRSRYTSGKGAELSQSNKVGFDYCIGRDVHCWRDNISADPLTWDFYRNAMTQRDQLRQRVALALQQILVVSNIEVHGTYGFRNYHNMLLDNAFGNYREVLKKVALSPVMGDYLDNVNNSKTAPNENFARELMQLFSIGTCELNADGTLRSGQCIPTYNNDTVRNYAFALTGWTYPPGGGGGRVCQPEGANCRYYSGDMVPIARHHDTEPRPLLAGKLLPAGHTAPEALEKVLDSLMAHPNLAPFMAKQLIQHLVSSNPSPAYVQRVAKAFKTGRYGDFGKDRPGDLDATVAAILLDPEARSTTVARTGGKLREPVLMFTGVLRALNGKTDGDALNWWWGGRLRQQVFRPPSVFNFYPSDNPVPGTDLVGPQFGIHEVSTALERLNFLTYLIDWGGSTPNSAVPNALGTSIDVTAFTADAADATKLVDRLSLLVLGRPLEGEVRNSVINSTSYWTATRDSVNWKKYRVNTAAYLIFNLPQYQVHR